MIKLRDEFKLQVFGLIAALLTVMIWATFLIATRFALQSDFTVQEVLVLRLLPASIIFAPLMFKMGVLPRGQSWPRSIILMVGASAVFPYIVSSGLAYAPASDGGALAPGMLPFWTAIAAFSLSGERPGLYRGIGLGMILLGAICVGLLQIIIGASTEIWKGHIMFLLGSGCFAIYSVVFRESDLSPTHGLVLGLFWGSLIITPILFLSGNVNFFRFQYRELLLTIVLQSFIIGVLATLLFNYAVQILGAAETGAFGALTPIIALLGGVILLDEVVTPLKVFGVLLVAVGVVLASGLVGNHILKRNGD